MPRVACRSCGYTRSMTKRELEFGMRCPECHGGNLKPIPKKTREGRVVSTRPVTVRSLIAGALLLVLGGVALAWGLSHMNGRGPMGARMVGGGVVLLIAGVVSLGTGLYNLVIDLK